MLLTDPTQRPAMDEVYNRLLAVAHTGDTLLDGTRKKHAAGGSADHASWFERLPDDVLRKIRKSLDSDKIPFFLELAFGLRGWLRLWREDYLFSYILGEAGHTTSHRPSSASSSCDAGPGTGWWCPSTGCEDCQFAFVSSSCGMKTARIYFS